MIDPDSVRQILAQYEKHGWKLRRVLLSREMRDLTAEASRPFKEAEVRPADIDALWFSRSSRPGLTAWEIRHLSTNPYALVTAVAEGASEEEMEAVLAETEAKLKDAVNARRRDN